MKINSIVFFLMLSTGFAQAQSVGTSTKALDESFDITGRKFATNPNNGIEGSPMLNENWATGKVEMIRGKSITDALFQFNLVTGQLFFKKDSAVFAMPDQVTSFRLNYREGSRDKQVYFRNNFPAVDQLNQNSFYEVLQEGKKWQLLKYHYKRVEERYEYSQPPKKVYQAGSEWYCFDVTGFQMKHINDHFNDLLKLFADKAVLLSDQVHPKNKKHLTDQEMLSVFELLNQ